ncbi:hypothetical protein HF576_08075 [Microbacterium sp. CFH 90308]|uniref:Lipoprotein n=1 Tax=Microbacterium salsuginis TaxID=2722803 RepID=A0ABX1KBQ7_9MICO|nr:hypothetical protein [Microbacterium sp. CFH 90308]NLP83800.1 hypothetical protein [Microbacterium sp. CFH 90308]
MKLKTLAAVPVAVAGLTVILGGCAWTGGSYAALDRDRQPSDELPDVVEEAGSDMDADSARYVGEHDGVEFWLARTDEPESVCLVVYPNDTDWVTGCGGYGSRLGVGGPSGDYVLLPDGLPAPDDTTKLIDNVYLVGD